MLIRLLFLPVLAFLLAGCTETSDRHLRVVIADTTPDRVICPLSNTTIYGPLLETVSIPRNRVINDGYQFLVCPVTGDLHPGIIDPVTLPIADHYSVRVDRDRKIQTASIFKELKVRLAEATAMRGDTNRTWLYRPLIEHLLKTAGDSAYASHKILIYSDGLENGNTSIGEVSFYNYQDKRNPDDWSALDTNYDTVASQLEALYGELPSLSGIEVTMIYSPEQDEGYKVDAAQKFMRRFLTDRGAEFDFINAPPCQSAR